MMKKYFYSLLAATGMLLATSCSHDELANEISSESKVVTFKVSVPKQFESRAIGDGRGANKLIYAMYEEGTSTPLIKNTAERKSDNTFEVKVPMAKDIQYDLLFLAYDPDCTAFEIATDAKETNLKALKFKNELDANQDYDAFVGQLISQGITASGQTSVTLYRPFAQINAATTAEDFKAAKDTLQSGIQTSELTIYNVPGTYDVTTGIASDSIDVVFKKADIPSSDKLTVNGKEYTYLTLAYVLAGDSTNSSTHQADFTFQRTSDGKQVSSLSFLHFPIQRNYRTNVIGRLLTELESYKVEIDNDFGTVSDEHIMSPDSAYRVYHVTSNAEWNDVAEIMASEEQDTLTVKLGAGMGRSANEIIASGVTTIHKNKTVFLDLNGYTLMQENTQTGAYSMIVNNGTLTITDAVGGGKISYADHGNGGNYVSNTILNNGTLTIESGIIENNSSPNVVANGYPHPIDNNGTLTINGGTITNNENYSSMRIWCTTDDNTIVTINGGTFIGSIDFQTPNASANKGTLTINDGTFTADEFTKCAVRLLGFGADVDEMNGYINGGTFEGEIALKNWSNGKFNSQVFFISGGTFTSEAKNATDETLLAEGCSFEENTNGTWSVKQVLEQDGENSYIINDLAGLKAFRNAVNNGNTFEGCTITLKNDINLNNEQWLPIGYWQTFNGTFDGGNHIISNLKHHGTEEDCYIGLFGYTDNAVIKNLTIKNVDLKLIANNEWAGGHMGALVGNIKGTTVIENINVIGTIKIEGDLEKQGAGRIGGVVGGNNCSVTLKNVSVEADENSFVKGNSSIGGIAGQLQGQATFENVKSNINVSAQVFAAGGIIGLTPTNTIFKNCSSSGNISLLNPTGNENNPYRLGGIAGSWDDNVNNDLTLTDCSYTGKLTSTSEITFDCDGYVGRGYSTINNAVVNINGDKYQYIGNGKYTFNGYEIIADGLLKKGTEYLVSNANGLAKFSAVALTGNNGIAEEATIQIMNDIDMGSTEFSAIIAQRGDKLTILGNGHTISNVNVVSGEGDNTTGQASMFYAFPNSTLEVSNLTLKDITVTAEANASGYAAAVVGYCEGTVNLENVDVENATVTGVKSSGMLAGHMSVGSSLKAEGCDLSGTVTLAEYEDNGHYAGTYIGTLAGKAEIINCTVDVKVSGNLNEANVGEIYGRKTADGSLN